jgi:hypothetical protein
MMVNSVIQLDLLFKQFKIKLCDISPFSSKISFKIPEFYGEVLRSWNKIGGGQTRTPLHFVDVRRQIIWGNKLIMRMEGRSINRRHDIFKTNYSLVEYSGFL